MKQSKPKTISARFQRISDGQFVGKLVIDEGRPALDCWLVFDDFYHPVKDPMFLKLSFEPPQSKP